MTIVQSIYGYCYFMCTKEQLQSCIWHILLALHRVGEWMCAFLEQICMSCVKCLPYSRCSRITFGNIIIIIHSTYVQFEHCPVTADVARCMRLISYSVWTAWISICVRVRCYFCVLCTCEPSVARHTTV